jgi:CheY-like chemotaxis protein
MHEATVLVIESGPEATLVCAALAKNPEVRVLDAPDVGRALKRLKTRPAPVALAIVGAAGLAKCSDLVKKLEIRGIPVVGVVAGVSAAARQRALAAGVREIHDRPTQWRPYAELIDSLVARFIRAS